MDTKKEQLLKKIFKIDDLTPILDKVLDDWANYTIDTKYQGAETIDEKIAVLNAKEKPIKIGNINKKLK